MIPEPAKHPQRCETCDHFQTRFEYGNNKICTKIRKRFSNSYQIGLSLYTEIVGCASHSSRPAPAAPEEEEKRIRKDEAAKASEEVLEQLGELNKYACQEYEEASCSDNEREMRIHLEYGNRTWGIIRSLREQTQYPGGRR